jgi:hypothetical protein
MRRRGWVTSLLVAFGVAFVAAPAHARQLFVTVSGTDQGSCESTSPCTPARAINEMARGADEVVVASGSYTITAPLVARDQVKVLGIAGQPRPVLTNDGSGVTNVQQAPGSSAIYEKRTLALEDQASAGRLRIVQTGERAFALELQGTAATDVVAVATGNYGRAVLASSSGPDHAVLRDAIAFAGGGAATAIQTIAGNLRLRNVLALAPNVAGDALDIEGGGWCYGFSCPGAVPAEVDAKNTILRGALADAALTTSGYPGSYALLSIDHSNFRRAAVLAPGGNGQLNDRGANQSAEPRFINSQAGDYRPASGSPTIDAGTADPENGAVDMDGNPRATGGVVDIGPFEYIAPPPSTDAGAPTTPTTPAPDTASTPPAPPFATTTYSPPTVVPAAGPQPKPSAKPRVPAACKKLKGAKRARCIKRQKALSSCKRLKASKRKACIRRANKIR